MRYICRPRANGFGRHPALLLVLFILTAVGWARASAAAVPGDADCSGTLNSADLGAVVDAIFETSACAGADVNGDQTLSAADLVAEIYLLGTPAPSPSSSVSPSPTPTPVSTPTASFSPVPSSTLTRTSTPSQTATVTNAPTGTASPT